MKKLFLLFALHFICVSVFGQFYDAGVEYNGTNDYITYQGGNLPIIISVPHGGLLVPSSIPDRSCNGCATANDTNTRALGISVAERIKTITGCNTHLVINELRRRKLDANREIGEAALGNVEAELAWTEYHSFIDSARAEIIRAWNRGLVIDLHGHGHTIQRLELGYRLSGSTLRMSDESLDNLALDDSPIKTLINETTLTLSSAVRGTGSLGDLFTTRGYDAVPSSTTPAPESNEAYFQGGYITDRYGSKDGSPIDAIQIECHQDVRFTDLQRNRFADSLAVVILKFLDLHYHMNLSAGVCQPTSSFRPDYIEVIEVYPNPVCEELNINISEPVNQAILYNNLGQKVLQSHNKNNLRLNNLPNGIYHLLIKSHNSWYRRRISIQCN